MIKKKVHVWCSSSFAYLWFKFDFIKIFVSGYGILIMWQISLKKEKKRENEIEPKNIYTVKCFVMVLVLQLISRSTLEDLCLR